MCVEASECEHHRRRNEKVILAIEWHLSFMRLAHIGRPFPRLPYSLNFKASGIFLFEGLLTDGTHFMIDPPSCRCVPRNRERICCLKLPRKYRTAVNVPGKGPCISSGLVSEQSQVCVCSECGRGRLSSIHQYCTRYYTRKSSNMPQYSSSVLSQQAVHFAKSMLLSVLLLAAWSVDLSQCRRLVEDIDNEISPSVNLAFREPTVEWVKISSPPKQVISKLVGSYVEFECEAMGSPAPNLQWLKGKTPLTENQSFESNLISESPSQGLAKVRARLVINYLLPIHSGRFTCVAESGSQVATADTTIYVIKKEGYERNFTQLLTTKILGAHHMPRISLWAPTYMDVIGTNVILPCKTLGNPKPSLSWIDPQGQEITEGNSRVSVLPDGELSIRSLSWADMGVYTCVARNMVGQDSAETFVYPMRESK